ncbi:hypothetical protein EJD97_008041 [Solanum chilense]|uniref:CCHC-type domain-containing protein n=1 Tax=Solanum chilense TaxID=4083 RepID=A0A6N2CI83_SOLCI|nr:hypothetical protein EJD97_008041 [Solanum chilense]
MNARTTPSRRVEEIEVNEEIPPQVEQVEKVHEGAQGARNARVSIVEEGNDVPLVTWEMTYGEIKEALLILALAFTTHVGEDPQEFLDGVYKVSSAMGVTYREKAQLDSYQLREVAQVWYTQWKDNRPVDSGPIELEEFKVSFLGKYFPRERREKKFSSQDEPRSSKGKHERGSGSQEGKPTCATCGNRHYDLCILGTGICFCCGKYGHKVRDCPARDGKQIDPNISKDDAPKKRFLYALMTRGENDDDVGIFWVEVPKEKLRVLVEGPFKEPKAVKTSPNRLRQSTISRLVDAPSMGGLGKYFSEGDKSPNEKSQNQTTSKQDSPFVDKPSIFGQVINGSAIRLLHLKRRV